MPIFKPYYPGAFMMGKNLPVPATAVDEGDQVRLTFNEAWLPYVLGAVAGLTRPEAWDADGDDLSAVMLEAEQLLTQWDEGSGGGPVPINWLLTQVTNHGRTTQFSRFPDVSIPDDQAEYICNIEPDLGFQPDVKIMGFILGFPAQFAGGLFAKILILPAVVGAVAVATFELEDLGGAISGDTQLLPIILVNQHLRSIRVIATGPIQIQLTIAGSWEVGPA